MAIPSIVFLVSAASLGLEVLLSRFLSVTQWNQMSFLVLGIALLGYGAGGTVVSLRATRPHVAWGEKQLAWAALGYSGVTLLSFAVVAHLGLDCFRLPVEPRQLAYLAATFLLLALPFLFAGLAVTVGYVVRPESTRPLYLASMAGSGVGALSPLLLVPLLGETGAFVATALLPLLGLLALRRRGRLWAGAATAVAAAAILLSVAAPGLWRHDVSPYKKSSQLQLFPGTRVRDARTGVYGRAEVLSSPALRFAPGLSLLYAQDLPPRDAVFVNGEGMTVVPASASPAAGGEETLASHYAAVYAVAPAEPRVLVVQGNGGLATLAALEAGALSVEVVVAIADVALSIAEAYEEPRVRVVRGNARALLASPGESWDVIHVDEWGSSIPGMDALSQHPLLTRDACSACLRRLSPGGVLSFSRLLLLPPAELTRLVANLAEAFGELGAGALDGHLAVLRSWDSATLLVSRRSLSEAQRVAIRQFASRWRFDLVYLPGLSEGEWNQYSRLAEPVYERAIRDLLAAYGSGTQASYLASLPFDASAQGDDRPFHSRFRRLRDIPALAAGGAPAYSWLLSGELIVLVVFALALLLGAPLALLPLVARPASGGEAGGSARAPPRRRAWLYFAVVGFGFMAAETAFLQRLEILFAHPVACFAAVLAVLTTFSGAGAMLGARVRRRRLPVLALGLLLGLCAVLVPPVARLALAGPPWLRVALPFLVLATLGLLMGLPFPAGMELLAPTAHRRGMAWAANGVAGVLGAAASMQIVLSAGVCALFAVSAGCYLLAAWLLPASGRPRSDRTGRCSAS